MTTANPTLDAEVTVAAVISHTEIPALTIAALQPGDVLETEPKIGQHPLVRLTVGTTIVALATIAKIDGRLIATIIETRAEAGHKGDQWKLKKPKPSTD